MAVITGTSGNETLTGTSSDDVFEGSNGVDVLNGLAGDDIFSSGLGWDIAHGREGDDDYRFAYNPGPGNTRPTMVITAFSETATTGIDDTVLLSGEIQARTTRYTTFDYGDNPNGLALSIQFGTQTPNVSGEVRIANMGAEIEGYRFNDGESSFRRVDADFLSVQYPSLYAGRTDDRFFGTEAGETITGGRDNAWIFAGGGDDVLSAGLSGEPGSTGRFQYLHGEEGNDHYRYTKSDGNVFIGNGAETATSGTADLVRFNDLDIGKLKVDLVDYGTALNGQVISFAWEDSTGSGALRIAHRGDFIEQFRFSDGMGPSRIDADFLGGGRSDDRLLGTDGDDVILGSRDVDWIYGGAGDDTLNAGATSDPGRFQYLFGQEGNDRYEYDGLGMVFIGNEAETTASGTADHVYVGYELKNLTLGNVDYGTASNGDALTISLSQGNQLRIARMGEYIEGYTFRDGVSLGAIDANFLGGTRTDDMLIGTSGVNYIRGTMDVDWIFGGAGNDVLDAGGTNAPTDSIFQYLHGEAGNDRYIYARESGNVFIGNGAETADSGTADRVDMSGFRRSDVTVDYFNYGSETNGLALRLLWDDGTDSGELRIAHAGEYIESFVFRDQTVAGFAPPAMISGTPGYDGKIFGTSADDVLSGGGSPPINGRPSETTYDYDELLGLDGNDTYLYGDADWNVWIDGAAEPVANGTLSSNMDRVVFTDGSLGDRDVAVGYIYNSLSGQEEFTIQEHVSWSQLNSGNEFRNLAIAEDARFIEGYEFADGTTLSRIDADFLSRLYPDLYPDRDDDALFGTSGDDYIAGQGQGIDWIFGGLGDDILDAGDDGYDFTDEYGRPLYGDEVQPGLFVSAVQNYFQYLQGGEGNDTYLYGKVSENVFIGNSAETASSGTMDRIVFTDLDRDDISVSLIDYGGINGEVLALAWEDDPYQTITGDIANVGALRVQQRGEYIEEYEFADGEIVTSDDLLLMM